METQRILDALVVGKLLPTLKYVINVNSQKKFIMNVPESFLSDWDGESFINIYMGRWSE